MRSVLMIYYGCCEDGTAGFTSPTHALGKEWILLTFFSLYLFVTNQRQAHISVSSPVGKAQSL